MTGSIPFAEFLNYVFFSLLVGHVILQYVPESKQPKIITSRTLLLIMPLGVLLFSFGPVLYVINYFAEDFGFRHTTYLVLTQFNVGKGWIITAIVSVMLWVTLFLKGSKHLQAFWLLLLIGSVGYASHVASLSFWSGFFLHTVHFLSVCVWVGILLQVAWFSKEAKNWAKFLRWFNPVAIGCVVILFMSGIFIMFKVVEPSEYLNSWAIPYGQMLLLKHISIIPVLVFAVINGILAKKTKADWSFQPLSWMRIESLILLIVFFFTSRLGTLSPPHESVETAPWMLHFLGSKIPSSFQIQLEPTMLGVILGLLSVLFLLLILISFRKNAKPVLALSFGLAFIVTLYFGFMFNITL